MPRCVIVGGADISNYDQIKSHLRSDDFLIFCDSGLRHLAALDVSPHLIVGDFDSHENPHLPVETITLPCEKDDTDTFFAVKEALRRGFEEFLLLGVIGGRLDHTLGNLSILLYLDGLGKQAAALDRYGQMEILSRQKAEISDDFSFFSLINISGTARGITVKNAKYPLENAEITPEYAYGVSNEPLPGQTATVSLREGRLLLVKIR